MKTLRDKLNEYLADMQEKTDKMKTLLMRDDIVWPEVEELIWGRVNGDSIIYHNFNEGEFVKVGEKDDYDNSYYCKRQDDSYTAWVSAKELEIYHE